MFIIFGGRKAADGKASDSMEILRYGIKVEEAEMYLSERKSAGIKEGKTIPVAQNIQLVKNGDLYSGEITPTRQGYEIVVGYVFESTKDSSKSMLLNKYNVVCDNCP